MLCWCSCRLFGGSGVVVMFWLGWCCVWICFLELGVSFVVVVYIDCVSFELLSCVFCDRCFVRGEIGKLVCFVGIRLVLFL